MNIPIAFSDNTRTIIAMRRPVHLVLFLLVVLIAVAAGAAFYIFAVPNPPSSQGNAAAATSTTQALTNDELAASSTVAAFGLAQQRVSILAPDASTTIAQAYGPYVDPALLSQWEANPQSAPGRATSSPWPANIIVDSISQNGAGYLVQGTLVLQSSTSLAAGGYDQEDPLLINVANENGVWMITTYQDLSGQQQQQ